MAKKKPKTLLKQVGVYLNEIDDAIEKETYANADVIKENIAKSDYLKKAHSKILEVLDITSIDDSKYYDYQLYEDMVWEKVKLREERKRRAEERKRKAEEKEKEAEAKVDAPLDPI